MLASFSGSEGRLAVLLAIASAVPKKSLDKFDMSLIDATTAEETTKSVLIQGAGLSDKAVLRSIAILATELMRMLDDKASSPSFHLGCLRILSKWKQAPKPLIRLLTDLSASSLRGASNGEVVRDIDLTSIARVTRSLEYERSGGRTLLLSQLHRLDRAIALNDHWWPAAVTELVGGASGQLAAVLEDDAVAATIIAPRVARALGEADTRALLFGLASSPKPISRHIDRSQFAATFERVAGKDPLAKQWLSGLESADALEELNTATRECERGGERAAREVAHLEKTLQDAEKDRGQLATQLREAVQSSAGANDAVLQQARLDVLHYLVNVALAALDVAAAHEDEAMTRKILFQTKRAGLEPIGVAGERA